MSILVIAEHSNSTLRPSTLNAITAAQKLGSDISVLVAGSGISAVAEELSKCTGVTKVVVANTSKLEHQLPEKHSSLHCNFRKNIHPYHRPCDSLRQKFIAAPRCSP